MYMVRNLVAVLILCLCILLSGCQQAAPGIQVAATTAPVYEFTTYICSGTDIRVGQIITESISCLHDYTLQTNQMRMIENAQIVILSGAGLEDFMSDILPTSGTVIDASQSIPLLCNDNSHTQEHDTHEHHHEHDPHIWLSPANACQMAKNICAGLESAYPQYSQQLNANLQVLLTELSALEHYGRNQLKSLSERQLITFHDGFSYLADAYDLTILHAIEEESGREASAAELIEICNLVNSYGLTAIFTEQNGSTTAAKIISSETGANIYQLDMAMSGSGYISTMYQNIETLKEALG